MVAAVRHCSGSDRVHVLFAVLLLHLLLVPPYPYCSAAYTHHSGTDDVKALLDDSMRSNQHGAHSHHPPGLAPVPDQNLLIQLSLPGAQRLSAGQITKLLRQCEEVFGWRPQVLEALLVLPNAQSISSNTIAKLLPSAVLHKHPKSLIKTLGR